MQPSPAPIELLVIGGGTAGLIAAKTAASFGAAVTLVERDEAPGGDCLWNGCVPSKTLIALSKRLTPPVDATEVRAGIRAAIGTIAPVDSAAALDRAGVRVERGTVSFTGPDTAEIDGRPVGFLRAVLATGSAPAEPDFAHDRPPLTNETVWDLERLPGRLLIVGGGSTGCELGQALARLGVGVTIVERGPRLLPGEDPDAGALIAEIFTRQGITLRLGRVVSSVEDGMATLDDDSTVAFDDWFCGLGRRPRTGLGLNSAGVELAATGAVRVDAHLRTSNERIWAAGDVTGEPYLTHRAGIHGSTVAANAVLGLRRSVPRDGWPRVTFTDPEVAAVGDTTGGRAVTMPHHHVDRAITDGDRGFTRVRLDRRRRIRGATVVSGRAGETLGEAALAVQQKVGVSDLVATTHAYPTLSDGLWNAAIMDYQARLASPPWRWLISGLRRWRLRGQA